MKFMSKKRVIIISVILVALLLTAAVAQNVVKHERYRNAAMMFPFGGHAVQFLTDYLDLSDQQRTAIKSILEQERTQMQPLLSNARQLHQQVEAQALSDNFDANQVRATLEQNKENLINLAVEAAHTQNEIYKVLTPEQRTKLATLRERHQEHMKRWMDEHKEQENKNK
jgi:periplasmic protein CpxP/Spy